MEDENCNNNESIVPVELNKKELANKYIKSLETKVDYFKHMNEVTHNYRCKHDIIYDILWNDGETRVECLKEIARLMNESYGKADSISKLDKSRLHFFNNLHIRDRSNTKSTQIIVILFMMVNEPLFYDWIVNRGPIYEKQYFTIWKKTCLDNAIKNYTECTMSVIKDKLDIIFVVGEQYISICGLPEVPFDEYNITPIKQKENIVVMLKNQEDEFNKSLYDMQ